MLSHAPQDVLEETRSSLSTQWTALRGYAERQTLRFLVHAMIFIALTIALSWARRRVRSRVEEDTDSAGTAHWYSKCRSPRRSIHNSFLQRLDLSPAAAPAMGDVGCHRPDPERHRFPPVARERSCIPRCTRWIVFYFVDQVRTVAAAVQVLPRLLFLAEEMVGGMLFLVWLVWSMGRRTRSTPETEHLRKIVNAAARAALVIAALAFMGNILGYVTLANLLGNALLSALISRLSCMP